MSSTTEAITSADVLRFVADNPKAHDMHVDLCRWWANHLDSVERGDTPVEPEPPYSLTVALSNLIASNAGLAT